MRYNILVPFATLVAVTTILAFLEAENPARFELRRYRRHVLQSENPKSCLSNGW